MAGLITDARQKFRVKAGTKVAAFLTSKSIVGVICGPLGSGKTKALCARPLVHAQQQAKSPIDGMRYTRFAMVRNTTPDLKRSTMRSWSELYPEDVYGKMRIGAPMGHDLKFNDVRCQVDFIGLDKDEDVRKLRSTEYTGVFFDELEYIEKMLFDEALSRLRYPSREHCDPATEDSSGRRHPTWRGVCAATNAPPEDHWLPIMTGQVEFPIGLRDDELKALQWPSHWEYHQQPAALIEEFDQHGAVVGYHVNPDAENLGNLTIGYYEEMIAAHNKNWIDSRLMVRTVLVTEGSAVWPTFRREVYVSREILRPRSLHRVTCGLDFGRSPAAVFMQSIGNRVLVQHELIGSNEGADSFAPKVRRYFTENYPEHNLSDLHLFGDPKGQDKGQNDDRTAYEIFGANGMVVRAPPNLKQNMIATRVGAVSHVLNEMSDGKPRFAASPVCRTLIVAMAGRYCNERDEKGELQPVKNRYSHVADALQYGILGLGEGRAMTGRPPIGDLKGVQTWKKRKTMRRLDY